MNFELSSKIILTNHKMTELKFKSYPLTTLASGHTLVGHSVEYCKSQGPVRLTATNIDNLEIAYFNP
jgi:hypothetical protein